MEPISLDNFLALNDQLVALEKAGIPVDVGLGPRDALTTEAVQRINATVVRRVRRGETLAEAIQGDDQDIPAAYRGMLQFGLQTQDLAEGIAGPVRVAEAVDESRVTLRAAMIYPLILLALAYIGLVAFMIYLVPILHGMYIEGKATPGPGLSTLVKLRESLQFLVLIPPIVFVASWLWLRSKRNASAGRLSESPSRRTFLGGSKVAFQERCAQFAELLSELLAKNVPFHEALEIAGDAAGDVKLRSAAMTRAAAERDGRLLADDNPVAKQFPPFLRWALWHGEESTGRVRALQIAATTYREAAQRRNERMRSFAPMIALVVLGGTVTLLYGLTLFIPMAEMIKTLSEANHT